MDIEHWLEFASDVISAIGAIVLVVPARHILETKRIISDGQSELRKAMESASDGDSTQLMQDFIRLETDAGKFDPHERLMILSGLWLLVAGFGLRIAYHILKFVPSWTH